LKQSIRYLDRIRPHTEESVRSCEHGVEQGGSVEVSGGGLAT